ncbi:MAG: hypothetical protein O6704_09760 [Nitrospinae bacterium]|nr:hypothetical protein [Nitrospinota bacterium]
MASKEDNPSPDMDAPAPENTPVPEEAAPTPEETPEAALSQETPPPAPFPARTSKKEKKFSGMGGTLFLLALLITGGAGAGGFYLYQEQIQFQNETLARISQLEAQLGALDTEADQTRQNQQLLDTLNQDLQQHKMDIDATLKAHQNSLATLDEDVLRLKEKVATPALPAPVIEGIAETPGLPTVPPPPETRDKDLPEFKSQEEPSQKTQPEDQSKPFLDWMENFFAAIWDWFAGLFS